MTYPYPQATATATRRGPHLAWLWLGVAMAVLAAMSVIVFVSMNVRALDAASELPQSGPGVVTMPLYEGHRYGVFLPADAWVPINRLDCTASEQAAANMPLNLEVWDRGWEGPEYEDFGQTWVVAGRFTSPVDGLATVQCEGAPSGLLLYPDDEKFMVLAAIVIAGGIFGLGGIALAISIGVVRLRRRRDGAAVYWSGAYGPYPPPYSWAPYPPAGYPGAPPDPNALPPLRWPTDPDPR